MTLLKGRPLECLAMFIYIFKMIAINILRIVDRMMNYLVIVVAVVVIVTDIFQPLRLSHDCPTRLDRDSTTFDLYCE